MGEHVIRIEKIAHHRNGVSGEPFYVVLFVAKDGRRMLGIVFHTNKYCSILDLELAADEGEIGFMHNSWRGDYFEPELRKAIAEWEEGGRK